MASSDIDVDEVFADFVEDYGGIVSDRIKGKKTLNADYVFHHAKVVAELKVLREDPFNNKHFVKSLNKKKREWVGKGYITLTELNRVTRLNQLPEKCWRDADKLFVRSLVTHVEKANRQIKTTKNTLSLPDYKGLLLLVSDGNFLLDPKNIRQGLSGLFATGRYSAINTVAYLTVNIETVRPDDTVPARLWINFWRNAENMQDEVSLVFLTDLCDKWADYFMRVTGMFLVKNSEVDDRGLTELDYLKDTQFLRPPKQRP